MANSGEAVKTAPWRDPAARPYVEIERVSKSFGDFKAVDDVSLKIYKGEIFCLLGASGCGKTTLLRMLGGFETPSSGRILIDGEDMSGVPPYERPVNMMFQSYALFPHMNVEQNVAFGLKQDRVPKAEIAERVATMLDLVKLGGFARRKPHQLSGGQRQRVALARSLVKRPKLLLLDEPLGALDKKLREHTQFELIGLQDKLGVTFLVVTHDQEEAMTLASRIGVMDHGEIVQAGTPAEIYEFPSSKFVADFVGSVNIFEGKLIEDEPEYVRIGSDELGGTLYVSHGISAAPEAVVWAAVRPEKIFMSTSPPPACEGGQGTDNVVRGAVQDIAYLGDLSIYLVKLPTGKVVRVTQPNTSRHAEAITWEQQVYLSWDASSPVVVTR
ncbi:MAG TPA: polyamine ABC transporter ATP-binding protein [Steroidobacteraceae bacterium]|jgi:putrescine transport system ATP-binding protein|nr:polyamine ABC transporter ATP-binding protein [Steroidobacteraceae bacterium]